VVWSPDSRYVAFDPGGVLKKVSLDGGAAQTVCELPGVAVGGSWNGAGDILVGNALGGLVRCPAAGGPAAIVTRPDPARQEAHLFPSFLADGRRFIYLSISRLHPEASGIYLGDLGAESRGLGTRLITTGFGAAFVAGVGSEPGAIVFARDGALFGQRFDERRLQLIGIPIRLAEGIGSYLDGAFFSVSSKILVHRAPEPEFQLTWFDRSGRELGRLGPPARLSGLALSPDDQRALVARHAPQGTLDQDLWMFDFARTAAARRMTFEPAIEASPVWVTNDRFAFGSGGGASGVFQQAIAGKPELLFRSGRPELPTSIAENGRIVLYTTITGNATSGDVWVRTGDGASASVHPFLQHERDQSDAHLSPDRRWVAYVSNETGPSEVSVTRFHFDDAATSPAPGESIRISEGGGTAPRWRSDGRELFYLTLDDSIMAIDVDNQREFRPGTAKPLFKVPGAIPHWGVTRDGARFLFAVPVSPPPPFEIVQDWQATLPR
jgi:hypothetical protein